MNYSLLLIHQLKMPEIHVSHGEKYWKYWNWKKMRVFLVLAVWAWVCGGVLNVVRTESGLVQGGVRTGGGGLQVEAFLGIPYASASRFQSPSAYASPWSGVRNSTRWVRCFFQRRFFFSLRVEGTRVSPDLCSSPWSLPWNRAERGGLFWGFCFVLFKDSVGLFELGHLRSFDLWPLSSSAGVFPRRSLHSG